MKTFKQLMESLEDSVELPVKCFDILKKHTQLKLTDGDCGIAAFAIVKYMNQISKEATSIATVGIVSDAINEDELFHGEPQVFHVYVEYGDKMYDANGEVTIGDLEHFVQKEYGEQKVVNFYGKFKTDNKLNLFINRNTKSGHKWLELYSILEKSK